MASLKVLYKEVVPLINSQNISDIEIAANIYWQKSSTTHKKHLMLEFFENGQDDICLAKKFDKLAVPRYVDVTIFVDYLVDIITCEIRNRIVKYRPLEEKC